MWRLLSALLLLFSFSSTEAAHQLRVRNEHERTIQELTVGTVVFSDIKTDQETPYQEIEGGSHVVKGHFEGQGYIYLDGTATIPPGPDSKWTLVLRSNRTFRLVEDVSPLPVDEDAITVVTIAKNRVRFVNRFDSSVVVVTIGTVTHRNIEAGSASRYIVMPAGPYTVTGEVQGFGPGSIEGSIDTTGYSNRRFSVVLDARGIILIELDL